MGQKVNPIVLRLSVNKDWSSKWFAKGKEYANLLHEDLKIMLCSQVNSRDFKCS